MGVSEAFCELARKRVSQGECEAKVIARRRAPAHARVTKMRWTVNFVLVGKFFGKLWTQKVEGGRQDLGGLQGELRNMAVAVVARAAFRVS